MARRTMVAALAVVLGGWGCWAQAQEQARIIRANGVEQPGAQTYWTEPTGGRLWGWCCGKWRVMP